VFPMAAYVFRVLLDPPSLEVPTYGWGTAAPLGGATPAYVAAASKDEPGRPCHTLLLSYHIQAIEKIPMVRSMNVMTRRRRLCVACLLDQR